MVSTTKTLSQRLEDEIYRLRMKTIEGRHDRDQIDLLREAAEALRERGA